MANSDQETSVIQAMQDLKTSSATRQNASRKDPATPSTSNRQAEDTRKKSKRPRKSSSKSSSSSGSSTSMEVERKESVVRKKSRKASSSRDQSNARTGTNDTDTSREPSGSGPDMKARSAKAHSDKKKRSKKHKKVDPKYKRLDISDNEAVLLRNLRHAREKYMKNTLHQEFLQKYIEEDRIPQGFKLKKDCVVGKSTTLLDNEWQKALHDCSMSLIKITIKRLDVAVADTADEVNLALARLDRAVDDIDKRQSIKARAKMLVDFKEAKLRASKNSKWARDNENGIPTRVPSQASLESDTEVDQDPTPPKPPKKEKKVKSTVKPVVNNKKKPSTKKAKKSRKGDAEKLRANMELIKRILSGMMIE